MTVDYKLQFEAQKIICDLLLLDLQRIKLNAALHAKQVEMSTACGKDYAISYDQHTREWVAVEVPCL